MMNPWHMHPWHMRPHAFMQMAPMRRLPLRATPTGAFPVPESLPPSQWPPAVRESVKRIFEGPPKPSVTIPVMNRTQASMIQPDLPNRSNV